MHALIICNSNFNKSKHVGGIDLNISKFHRFYYEGIV